MPEIIIVAHNIRSTHNVGAIFRSAAALNMDGILLTSDCSDPLYRRSLRVSMGTAFQIPWTYFDKKASWPEERIFKLVNSGRFRISAGPGQAASRSFVKDTGIALRD